MGRRPCVARVRVVLIRRRLCAGICGRIRNEIWVGESSKDIDEFLEYVIPKWVWWCAGARPTHLTLLQHILDVHLHHWVDPPIRTSPSSEIS